MRNWTLLRNSSFVFRNCLCRPYHLLACTVDRILQIQARIHTGFHCFTEIGQIFHDKYIFNYHVDICQMVLAASKYPVWMTPRSLLFFFWSDSFVENVDWFRRMRGRILEWLKTDAFNKTSIKNGFELNWPWIEMADKFTSTNTKLKLSANSLPVRQLQIHLHVS